MCTGTAEEGPLTRAEVGGAPKPGGLRQNAPPSAPPASDFLLGAPSGQVQLEPATKDNPHGQPPGAEGKAEKAGNGWSGSDNQHRGLCSQNLHSAPSIKNRVLPCKEF